VAAHRQTGERKKILNNIDEIAHHGVLPVHVLPLGIRLLYTTN